MIRVISNTIPRFWCALTLLGAVFSAANSTALETEECALKVDWQSINSSSTYSPFGEYSIDLAEDEDGNILVCGFASTEQVLRLWRVEKFSPSGESMWFDEWSPNEEMGDSVALRLALTPDAGVAVAGWSSPPGPAITVRKYGRDGNLQWTFTNSGTEYEHARGTAIAANDAGEIYVAGVDGFHNLILLKLNPEGAPIWIHNLPLIVSIYDLAILGNGDIAGSGLFDQTGEPMVMRFGPDGNIKWTWKGDYDPNSAIMSLAVDTDRLCFYGVGGYESVNIVKFEDDPSATSGNPEWIGSYDGANPASIAADKEGRLWVTGRTDSLWSVLRFDPDENPGIPPYLACITSDYNWTVSHGVRGGKDGEAGTSGGMGIVCKQKGGIASCGYVWTDLGGDSEVVVLAPDFSNSKYPGPVANGSPTEPGPEHPGGLKPGDVRVAGGTRGLVDPRRGEGASVSVYPTSAGTVTLTVIDRKGGVVKQVSAAASGAGSVTLTWDGKNASGAPAAPGIYAVRVEGPGIRQVSKVAVVY